MTSSFLINCLCNLQQPLNLNFSAKQQQQTCPADLTLFTLCRGLLWRCLRLTAGSFANFFDIYCIHKLMSISCHLAHFFSQVFALSVSDIFFSVSFSDFFQSDKPCCWPLTIRSRYFSSKHECLSTASQHSSFDHYRQFQLLHWDWQQQSSFVEHGSAYVVHLATSRSAVFKASFSF